MRMYIFNIRVNFFKASQRSEFIPPIGYNYLSLCFIVHILLYMYHCILVFVDVLLFTYFVSSISTDCVCYLLTNAPLCNILLSILPLHTLTYLFLVLPSKYPHDASPPHGAQIFLWPHREAVPYFSGAQERRSEEIGQMLQKIKQIVHLGSSPFLMGGGDNQGSFTNVLLPPRGQLHT